MTQPDNTMLSNFYDDLQLVCCADPRWAGCPHPIVEHDTSGSCTVRTCPCTRLIRHPDGCVHTPPDHNSKG